MKLWFNLLCRDIDSQIHFYKTLLGLPEALASQSPIYRALETPDFQFGFNAQPAYALLNLADRMPADGVAVPVVAYATLMLDTPDAVTAAAVRVTTLGGTVVKTPYATYYGQWQAVLADPEGNIFRLSAQGLPAGEQAPALESVRATAVTH